jgi:hypothetical protein
MSKQTESGWVLRKIFFFFLEVYSKEEEQQHKG